MLYLKQASESFTNIFRLLKIEVEYVPLVNNLEK